MSARRRILPVFIANEGCPHQCVFCDQRRITGSVKPVTGQDVLNAVKNACVPTENAELAFYGGSFTAIPAERQTELLSAAAEARRLGLIRSIRLSTRPDAIDGETLDRLERFGVETVELGAQSMDDEVLRLSGRGHSAQDVERAARLIKKRGFGLILQMMTGLPGDTKEKSLETALRLCALRPDGVRIYPTVIIRETPLYELWLRGVYREHSVDEAVDWCAALLELFESAGIPVIRLGLNPTDELSGGEAAAGAYHPALGELVKSRRLLDKARAALQDARPGVRAALAVHPSCRSQLVGQKRQNVDRLLAEFALSSLDVVEDPSLSPGAVRRVSAADR
ncbi:MAG: radical SAM protein [Oscillospiraceae bacterium]|nr:radical SAM protein [Oscillospiraceae bacterium]